MIRYQRILELQDEGSVLVALLLVRGNSRQKVTEVMEIAQKKKLSKRN